MDTEYTHGDVKIFMWPDYTKDQVAHIVENLRPSDRHELRELGIADDDQAQRCIGTIGSTPVSYLVTVKDEPVFIYGATFQSAGMVMVWGFGTYKTSQAINAITRHIRRIWLTELRQAGVRRLEARLPTTCRESLQWLKSCGFEHDCTLHGVSVTGASFEQLSLVFSRQSPQPTEST